MRAHHYGLHDKKSMPHFPEESMTPSAMISSKTFKHQSKSRRESSEAREARLQIKDRRRRYLEMHPDYFESSSLELADPLLYDRMIRRFQSASERELEGRKKGYSGVLEADLMRSEAKVEALAHPDPNSPLTYHRDSRGAIIAVEQDEEDRPKTREEGLNQWKNVMELRFLRGEDKDFDYEVIDGNEQYDDWNEERRKREDDYFDDQDEEYLGDGDLQGETGVQDF